MKWLQQTFSRIFKTVSHLAECPIIFQENNIFSIPLSDMVFDFNCEVIPEFQKWVLDTYDIKLDEVIICNYTHLYCKDNPSQHKYQNETHLDVIHRHDKYIGILTIVNDLKQK